MAGPSAITGRAHRNPHRWFRPRSLAVRRYFFFSLSSSSVTCFISIMASPQNGHRGEDTLPSLAHVRSALSSDEATFPTITTRVFPSEVPDEYRAISPTGLVQVSNAELARTATAVSLARGQPPQKIPPGDVEFVTWLPNDPENPHNWGRGYRWYYFFLSPDDIRHQLH
jgi:hypothetical protein